MKRTRDKSYRSGAFDDARGPVARAVKSYLGGGCDTTNSKGEALRQPKAKKRRTKP